MGRFVNSVFLIQDSEFKKAEKDTSAMNLPVTRHMTDGVDVTVLLCVVFGAHSPQ